FSSRRRHTRSKRDWSSDVCSSDLHGNNAEKILVYKYPPISTLPFSSQSGTDVHDDDMVAARAGSVEAPCMTTSPNIVSKPTFPRSEERRVGKEWRFRRGRAARDIQ